MKKAVMYGAGNIGRGFIGQLLSQSGYEVVFLDINKKVIDALQADRKYVITTVSNEKTAQIVVENVRAVNTATQEESAIREIADCDIMATAVGANILKFIAPLIAKGLALRASEKRGDLNILLCENLMDVNRYMRSLLEKELGDSGKDILPHVGFVEASIGRMVPVSTGEKYPTDITVEEFDILHTDKDGFVGEIPPIRNMIAYSPFEAYIRRKLFMHNMGHAVTAYLGALKGYEYISQAIDDVEIRQCVLECGLESAMAIAADGFPLDELLSFYTRLLYRFGNEKLKDTILRVGRDTPRKLAANDRITGAINLCRDNGVPYAFLLVGVAAGMLFDFPEDPESSKVFRDAATDLRNAIGKFTGINDEGDIQAIETIHAFLRRKDFRSVIRFCEKRKAEKIQDR